jgi:hypothetical protein
LVRAQVLKGGDERELDTLALFVAGFRRRPPGRDANRIVGVRLEPGRLGDRGAGRRARLSRRAEIVREHPSAASPQLSQADVRGDRIQPRPGRAGVTQPCYPAPRPQQHLLHRVVGVVYRAEHPVAVRVELGSVWLNEIREIAVRRSICSQRCSTTISEWPMGSRSQNIGGTGSPIRDTSASHVHPAGLQGGVGGVDVAGGQRDPGRPLRRVDLHPAVVAAERHVRALLKTK